MPILYSKIVHAPCPPRLTSLNLLRAGYVITTVVVSLIFGAANRVDAIFWL